MAHDSQPSKRKLVVGLGNPGHEYLYTRHNIGWRVLDTMQLSFHCDKAFQANIATTPDCVYIQPLTFMNCSGEAVRAVANYYNIPPQNIIVVYDDKDIPFGTIRLRSSGSSAGHNGVQSVIQHMGTADFARIRIGVQQETPSGAGLSTTANFVLANFNEEEEQSIPQLIETAVGAIVFVLENPLTPKNHTDLNIFAKGHARAVEGE